MYKPSKKVELDCSDMRIEFPNGDFDISLLQEILDKAHDLKLKNNDLVAITMHERDSDFNPNIHSVI